MMITFNQVSKKYSNDYHALKEVNFTLNEGEMAFLTGHSGAGKSTMLKLLALIERPVAGEIRVKGELLSHLKRRDIARYRLQLGLIFQSPYLLTDKNLFDNVALPLRIQGEMPHIIKKRVEAALDKVGLLSKVNVLPSHLSFGEQQRASIARAIVHKPMLLLADEPTGNLDPTLASDIMNLFTELNRAGVSVLIATHDLALIASMKHRIVVLKKGQIV